MKYFYLIFLLSCSKKIQQDAATTVMAPLYSQINIIDNGKYNAFGITFNLKDGSTAIVYREGTTHVGDAGVIKMRTSKDWNASKTIYADSLDDRNVAGGVTNTGRIIIFFTRYKNTCRDMGYIYSDDDGVAWSKYKTVSVAGNGAYSFYGSVVNLPDGSLLQSWYGVAGAIFSSYVIKSMDNGNTWSAPLAVLSSSTFQYTETSFMSLGGANIIGLARGENTDFYTQILSSDNGSTWKMKVITADTTAGIKSPPWLFNNGTPMCIYTNRKVNKIRLMSFKNGEWMERKDLCSLDAGGYPSVDKNGVGWFWNQTTPNNAQIVLFKLNIP